MPGAWHYVISTFFDAPLRKERTTLVPPILRPELRAARREPGAHVLVYQASSVNADLVPQLLDDGTRLPNVLEGLLGKV